MQSARHPGSVSDHFHPLFEAMEPRMLLSVNLLDNGTLEVFGTTGDDSVIIQDAGAPGDVRLFGVQGVSDSTIFEGVTRLRVKLKAGDDSARIDGIPREPEGEVMPIFIFGGAGDDDLEIVTSDGRMIGNRGNDTLFGGPGENKLVGGPGTDFLAGGGGDDKLIGNFGRDRLFGEAGDDLLRGGRANDLLRGGSGNDELFGGKNDDDLFGGSGFDLVNGSSGSDAFRGTFFEWDDFNSEDQYFNDLFNTDPRAVTLPDAFWAEMNAIDSEFGFLLPDEAWRAVDALQDLYATAPDEVAALNEAADQLDDAEAEALANSALGVFAAFIGSFNDPTDIDASSLSGLFVDLSDLMPAAIALEFDTLVDAIQGDQQLIASVVLGVQEMAIGQFPSEFEALIYEFVFQR